MIGWGYDILQLISWITYLISSLSLIHLFRKSMVTSTMLLLAFLLLGLFAEVINEILLRIGVATNVPVIIYTIIVSPILIGIYIKEIKLKSVRQFLTILASCLFFSELIWFIMDYKMIMPNVFYLPLTIICILLSLFYLIEQFIRLEIPDLTRHLFFWVNSALMIYFGVGYFLFIFEKIIRSDEILFSYIWPIQIVSTILLNSIITYGAWKTRQI